MEKAIKNVKEAFESDSIIITKIKQGFDKKVLVDAKTRFHKPDMDNFFSKWVSEDYANRMARDNYGKNIYEFSTYIF